MATAVAGYELVGYYAYHGNTPYSSSTTTLLRINDDIMMTDASEFFFLSIASNLLEVCFEVVKQSLLFDWLIMRGLQQSMTQCHVSLC